MPRSIGLFKKLGMSPILAPTDFLIKENGTANPRSFFASIPNIIKADCAIYEYLRINWAKLRGKI